MTKRIAERGFDESTLHAGRTDKEQLFQRFAITLDNQIVSLATIDFVQNPEGIDGRTGAQIDGHRRLPADAKTSPRACASARCRSSSS